MNEVLSGLGLAGLVIAALGAAVLKLYQANQQLHKEKEELHERWRKYMQKANDELLATARGTDKAIQTLKEIWKQGGNTTPTRPPPSPGK